MRKDSWSNFLIFQGVSYCFMYEATDDVEGVLQTLMEGAEHELVGGSYGPLRGKAEIGRFYEHLFPCLKDGRVEPVMRLYGDDFLIDESIWIGHLVYGRPFKLDGRTGGCASGSCTSLSYGMGSSQRRTSGLILMTSGVS